MGPDIEVLVGTLVSSSAHISATSHPTLVSGVVMSHMLVWF